MNGESEGLAKVAEATRSKGTGGLSWVGQERFGLGGLEAWKAWEAWKACKPPSLQASKPCKPSKGKRFAKRVDGKCRSYGQAGQAKHILNPGDIPVVQIDRGGQVTYHGPGQLVAYLLINVRRRNFGARALVDFIENALLATLKDYGIAATTKPKAPGVYVNDAKIAAVGLRIKNGWSYHGLSLNVNMDLAPFSNINPCSFIFLIKYGKYTKYSVMG